MPFRYISWLIFILSSMWFNTSFASFTQLSHDPNMTNPAELMRVMHMEFQSGFTAVNLRFEFNGTGAFSQQTGIVNSRPVDFLPFGTFAVRINDKIVVGLTATPVQYVNIQWPWNSIIGGSATHLYGEAWDFSPKLSYQICPNLSIGIGFDPILFQLKNYDNHPFIGSSALIPENPAPDLGEFHIDNGSGVWRYAFDLGLSYGFRPTCIPQFPYMSVLSLKIFTGVSDKDKSHGNSTWGAFQSKPTINYSFPPSVTLSYLHAFNMCWLVKAELEWAGWSVNKHLNFQNIMLPYVGLPGTLDTPLNFKNVWSYSFMVRRSIAKIAGIFAGAYYETNTCPKSSETVNFPIGAIGKFYIGVDSYLSKEFAVQLFYLNGHFMPNHIQINHAIPGVGFDAGHVSLHEHAIFLKFKYAV